MPAKKTLVRVGNGFKVHLKRGDGRTFCGWWPGPGVRRARDSDICNNCWRNWLARG